MKKLWIGAACLAFVLFTHSSVWAQPKIEFKETQIDFGLVAPFKYLHHGFEFKNAGNEPLIISDVHTTCGCTAAVLSATTIAAGATDIISVTMHTGLASPMWKQVNVQSNDPVTPTVTLDVKAAIKKVWNLSPQAVYNFGDVPYEGEKSITLNLVYEGEGERKITSYKVNNPSFTVSVGETQGKITPVTVSIKAGRETANIYDQLTIMTDDPEQPAFQTAIQAKIIGPIRFNPPSLFFGNVKPGAMVERTILATPLNEESKDTVEITGVDSEPGLVKGEVVGRRPDGTLSIKCIFTAPNEPGFKQGKIIVKSNLPGISDSTLNFTAVVR